MSCILSLMSSSYGTNFEKENVPPQQLDSTQRKTRSNFTPYQPNRRASSQPLEDWQYGRATPNYQEANECTEAMTNFHPSKGFVTEIPTAVGSAFSQAKEPAEVKTMNTCRTGVLLDIIIGGQPQCCPPTRETKEKGVEVADRHSSGDPTLEPIQAAHSNIV